MFTDFQAQECEREKFALQIFFTDAKPSRKPFDSLAPNVTTDPSNQQKHNRWTR